MHECYVHIKDGVIANPRVVKKAFTLKDGVYKVTIKHANKRSLQQNRYYFGVVVNMVQDGLTDLGHDISQEEVHEWLKSKFNYTEIVNESTGEYERIPRSTTALSKLDFCEYIEKIQRFASEFLNIVIPNPGEQVLIDYE